MSFRIENTTKKERAKIVEDAFEISVMGNEEVPSDDALKYIEKYINGEIEIEDAHKKILELYNEN